MKSFLKALLAVTCAMFGVRSSKGLEEDKNIPLYVFLIVAFFMTILFIGVLIFIIKFIVLS